MARHGRRLTRGREWWFRFPDSPRPILLRFPTPVCELEARRWARLLLGRAQLRPGTVVTPAPLLAQMKE